MSEPIKAGDLVAVVKPAACCTSGLGRIFRVVSLESKDVYGEWACRHCGAKGVSGTTNASFAVEDGGQWHSIKRLKRIPPLDELEGVKGDKEITA